MAKHFEYVGDEPRTYSELPYAFGVVNPGDVVESDQDDAPDFRWKKSSKSAHDKQQKSREQEPASHALSGDEPLAQPDPESAPSA